MSTTDSIRDAFEAHWPNAAKERDGDTYDSTIWECRWEGWQAAAEAAKATGTADIDLGEDLLPLPEPIEVGGEGWDWEDFQNEKTFSADHMTAYGRACSEAARHDKDGNHADDLRGMLDELQAQYDQQESAFMGCSAKLQLAEQELAAARRPASTVLSDSQCALKGGKCSCPTACQRNMQEWTTYWRGTADPVGKQRQAHCPNCGAYGEHVCPAGSLPKSHL